MAKGRKRDAAKQCCQLDPLKASGVSAPDSEESNLMILECQEVRSGWSCSARWQREHADELDS